MPRPKPQDTSVTFTGFSESHPILTPAGTFLDSLRFEVIEGSGPIAGTYLMCGPQGRTGWMIEPGDTITALADGGLSIVGADGRDWAFEEHWPYE